MQLRALRQPASISRQGILQELHRELLAKLGFNNTDSYRNGEFASAHRVLEPIRARPAVVFDVGANRGDYAAMLIENLKCDLELHCFEPSETAFSELALRFRADGRVRLHHLGLSDRACDATLRADERGSACGSLYRRAAVQQRTDEHVRLQRLDAVCDEAQVSVIDLLKVDAEGHELAVLAGAGALLDGRRIRAIQFEYGGIAPDARIFLRDFFDLLGPTYRIHRLLPDGIWPLEPYAEDMEVTLYANYLALPR